MFGRDSIAREIFNSDMKWPFEAWADEQGACRIRCVIHKKLKPEGAFIVVVEENGEELRQQVSGTESGALESAKSLRFELDPHIRQKKQDETRRR
jgi:hypothetical protein